MPSPFPGMDPYLEQHWGDVHHSFITYARDQLRERLPKDLRARVEERVYVETPLGPERVLVPDLRILEKEGRGKSSALSAGVAVAEPLILQLDEPVTEGFIEIIDVSSGNRVVTVLEVLSQSNKLPGEGRDQYLRKQRELRAGHVSLVEIDLLRQGQRLLSIPLERVPAKYRTPYQVCVCRGWQPGTVEIYRVPLRERLPIINIPLRQADSDVPLDLQILIDLCYRNGSYEEDLNYQEDPEPSLEGGDVRWADALLRKQGRRRSGNGRRQERKKKA